MINDHKNKSKREIQLTAVINFISSKPDSDETRIMYKKRINVEIMTSSDTDEVIEKVFESRLQKYQENLEKKMRGSEFVFDGVNALYYDLNKISLNRSGSYIDSPQWLKNKKATINHKNNDDKCFQYAISVALNYQNIEKDPQRITKIKPFIDQYDWNDIDFPSHSKDQKKFESNNKSIALNTLYVPHNTKKIRHAYKSKYKNQAILLMVTDVNKWHYLAVKSLSALLRGIASKHKEEFYCLNCFTHILQKIDLKNTKKYAKIMITAM